MADQTDSAAAPPAEPTAGDLLTETLANETVEEPPAPESPPEAPEKPPEPSIKDIEAKWEQRYAQLETSLGETRAENTFLRGRVQELSDTYKSTGGRNGASAQPTQAAPEGPTIDKEALKRAISGDNPDAAADAIISVAKQLSEHRANALRETVTQDIGRVDQVRAAMEEDKANVLAVFSTDMQDPEFVRLLEGHQRASTQGAGKYVPGSLYRSAAAARLEANAKKTPTGPQRLRPEPPRTPIESSPGDYRKATTIDTLPGFSLQEKTGIKNYIRKTPGMTEAKWLSSYKAAKEEDTKLGE